ncbi:MAG: OmpA family protein [Alphaproteobacteria bacterium]
MSEHQMGNRTRLMGRLPSTLTALALVLALSGCSMMPDLPDLPDMPDAPSWVNPFNWFDGDDDIGSLPKAPGISTRASSSDKPFPKLAATPVPKSPSSAKAWEKLANSLVADRDNARYTDQNLRAGNERMAAAPPPPTPTPLHQAKPAVPTVAKQQLAAVPAAKGTAARLAPPALPPAPRRVAGSVTNSPVSSGDSSALTKVPSIVQRRGSLPPPPAPITEVSRGAIPQLVQKPGGMAVREMARTPALPKPPAVVALKPVPVPTEVARPAAIKLIPSATQIATAMPPSVQVNLPVGSDQSILTQTYAASLAAQGSPVVRHPGNVFNAPNARPISGQWPTVVPRVVRQAFNASLEGTDQGVATQPQLIASPQMSNATMRRLPGAPMLIRFRHGSTRLSAGEKQRLGQVASQAKGSGRTILVVGHASLRTSDMAYAKHKLVNFGVSLDRANSVAGELRRHGLASEQIVVQAKGDSEPLYFEFMPNGEAQNRRVEVFVR